MYNLQENDVRGMTFSGLTTLEDTLVEARKASKLGLLLPTVPRPPDYYSIFPPAFFKTL